MLWQALQGPSATRSEGSSPQAGSPPALPEPPERRIPAEAQEHPRAKGVRRWLFVALGAVFTGLGGIGVVLPGIPTTPFLLLASYFFVRSSPRLHNWLLASATFGPVLRDWHEHRGLRRGVKRFALAACAITITLSVALGSMPWLARVLVVLAGGYGIWFVACLPVVPDDPR